MKKLLFIAPILITGCLEFFAPNVEEVQISLLTPADSLITNQSTLIFRWESEASVESYRFQLAQPDFESPTFLVDTLLTGSRLDLSVPEGAFQWQVRAEHPGSESAYSVRKGWVDQTPPFPPIILFPQDGDTVSNPVTIRWESRDNLEWTEVKDSVFVYRVFGGEEVLEERGMVSGASLLLDGLEDGGYWAAIKSIDLAENASAPRSFLFVVQ